MKPVTLYAAQVSLYSGKTRSYLRYKGIPFNEVLPSQHVLQQIIKPRTGLAMIPVVITADDHAVQDTSSIIDFFEAQVPERPVMPAGPVQRLVAHLIELYADEWLLLPAMHYRWAYPRHHAWMILREFGAMFAPNRPKWMQPIFGLPVFVYFGLGHGRVLGIDRHTRGAIEAGYERFLAAFDAHLAVHPYVLGGHPTLADFGLMAPLYAHLYRDPYSGRLMKRLAPRVADWVERMNAPEAQTFGPLVPDDHIPDTLLPILTHAFTEQWPVIADTWAAVTAPDAAHPDGRLPRFVGRHRFRVGDAHSTRAIQSYTAWMSQRSFAAYSALDGEERVRADTLLDQLGGDAVKVPPKVELTRKMGKVFRGSDQRTRCGNRPNSCDDFGQEETSARTSDTAHSLMGTSHNPTPRPL
ncbi:MAG: glutathione S-transferase family protein [Myxococcota bacterium]